MFLAQTDCTVPLTYCTAILAGQLLADVWIHRRRQCKERSQQLERLRAIQPLYPVDLGTNDDGEEPPQIRKPVSSGKSPRETSYVGKNTKVTESRNPLVNDLQSRQRLHRSIHPENENRGIIMSCGSDGLRGRRDRMRRFKQQRHPPFPQPYTYRTRSGRPVTPTWKVVENYETERLLRLAGGKFGNRQRR